MPIIIDGWNLIRNERSGIRDDDDDALESARILVGYLERFQLKHNDPILLVFDSSSGFLDIGHRNSAKIRIIAARNADDYIRRHIEEIPERQRRNLRVVSSDNSVYYHAKSSYATPIRCEEFWDKLSG